MLGFFLTLLPPKPVLISGSLVILFLVTLFCVFSYFFIDKPLLFALVTLPSGLINWFQGYTILGEAIVYLTPALLLLPLSFLLYRHCPSGSFWSAVGQKSFSLSLLWGASICSSGLLVNGIKLLVGRYRPFYLLEKGLYGFQGLSLKQAMNSFPSGHSQTVWAAMLACCFLFPRLRWLWLLFAVSISFSRLITHYHYLSDVVMGGYLGTLSTVFFFHFLKKRHFFLKPVAS